MDEIYTPIDIVLDSGDLTAGSTDLATFTLNPAVEDVVGVTCFYANIPFTYNVVDGFNNKILFTAASVVYNLALTPGTYTPSTLIQELNAALRDSGFAAYASFNFFIANDTNKLTVYNNIGGGDISFSLGFDAQLGAGDLLGFKNGKSYLSGNGSIRLNDDTIVAGAEYIESPFSVNLSGPGQMYLHSPQLQGLTNGAVRAGPTTSDIVAFWPVNANYLGNIIHQPATPAVIPFTQTTISNISFYLTLGTKSKYGDDPNIQTNYLSLKGQSYQIGFRFYRKNQIQIQNDGQSQRISTFRAQPRMYDRYG
jgi:hypothetical protein